MPATHPLIKTFGLMKRYSIPRFLKTGVLLLLTFVFSFTELRAQTVKVFATSGTFTVPACVTSITVMCWGAGGGGGGAGEPGSGATGSGGGGGGFAQSVLNNVSGTFTVTVGTAGTGGNGNGTNGTAGGSSIVTNGTITVTGVGGGAGLGSSTGVASPAGAGGGGTFVGCTGTIFTGGSGALGNNGDDNTGGAGGGGAGNAGNGVTPPATTQDNNATGGAGGAGTPNTAGYAGGMGGSVSAAYHENGGNAQPGYLGGGGAGGGGENQLFHGTGNGTGGVADPGQVIITYSLSTPAVTSVTGGGCVGTTVTITGTLLSGATSATINGTALTNLTVTNTQITGTIAAGTNTGTVTVTTPCGTASGPAPFTVYPAQVVNLGTHTFCTSYTFAGQTYTTGGNYTTTVPSTLTGCDSTTNITLILATVITQSIAENICQNSGFSFGGHNYTTSGTYKDTAVSLSSGCDSITTLTLNVYPSINAAISQTICSGTNYTFGTQTLTQSGTYKDTAVSTVTGCDSFTTLTLTVNQTPAGTVTPASPGSCPGVPTTLTASPAGLYLWSDGETTAAISPSPNVTTGYTVTESNGICTATGTATITVTPFSITITPDTTRSCIAAAVTLTCSYTSINPNSYTWSATPTTGSSPGHSQGVVVYPLVTTVYGVTVSNGSCTASASAVVLVDTPAVTITPAVAGVCLGNSTTLTASGSVNYSWSSGSNTAATVVSPVATTKYIVTGTDAQGCETTDSITVTVGPVPTAVFTLNPNPVCAGVNSAVTYTGISDTNAVYTWYFGGGTVAGGTAKGPYEVNWSTSGTDTVILNVADNGCFATPDTVLVTVKPLPVFVTGNPPAFCGGDTVTMGNTDVAGYTYLWAPATGLSSDTTGEPGVSLPNTGTTLIHVPYVLTVTSNGCMDIDTVIVSVKPAPQAQFSVPASGCITGNDFNFASTGSALPTDSFVWNFGANATPPTSAHQTQSVTYTALGSSTASLTIYRAGCSSNTDTETITIFPEPSSSFTASTQTGCPGTSICFTNTALPGSTTTYQWSFGDGQTSTAASPCNVYSTAGNYNVGLSVTANGCSTDSNATNYIKIFAAPTASFTPGATVIQLPQTAISFLNTSSNATGFNWNFGGLGTSTDSNATYNFTQYGTYNVTLYASNINGCVDSTTQAVKVLPAQNYFIPDAFTPNGDGKNDDFFIEAQEGVTVIEFSVFDRWGEKVYDDPATAWDGTFKGQKCQEGVYVYIFKLRLANDVDGVKKMGTVTLLR
jgi:gliding motility-associated-like protein